MAIITTNKNKTPLGIYIHIPFCKSKCDYCDFCSFPDTKGDIIERYVNALCERKPELKKMPQIVIVVDELADLMMVAGKDGKGAAVLRLWSAKVDGIDMAMFNQGDYMRAMEEKAMAEVISKVLYPADNHQEGKSLRLKQQYFLVSASIQDIVFEKLQHKLLVVLVLYNHL